MLRDGPLSAASLRFVRHMFEAVCAGQHCVGKWPTARSRARSSTLPASPTCFWLTVQPRCCFSRALSSVRGTTCDRNLGEAASGGLVRSVWRLRLCSCPMFGTAVPHPVRLARAIVGRATRRASYTAALASRHISRQTCVSTCPWPFVGSRARERGSSAQLHAWSMDSLV